MSARMCPVSNCLTEGCTRSRSVFVYKEKAKLDAMSRSVRSKTQFEAISKSILIYYEAKRMNSLALSTIYTLASELLKPLKKNISTARQRHCSISVPRGLSDDGERTLCYAHQKIREMRT